LIGYNGSAFTTAAAAQNVLTAALLDITTGAITHLRLADVATDNSTVLLPVKASEIGHSPANPRFTYMENHFGPDGSGSATPGVGTFNAFTPALSATAGVPIAPGGSATSTVSVNAAEAALSPALGMMIVAPDNVSGPSQARLIPN